jgi:prolipoprotein diacylglyceryltransferase
MLSYILWNQDPILFKLDLGDTHFEARWYGLLFALAFVAGQYIMAIIFKAEGKTEKQLESLTLYMILATVVGARLGHCLLYEPDYYLSHPIEILKVWKGGLASHGASIGIITALYFWARKEKISWLWILDRMVIIVALGGMFIRLGNLMNSEIVGKPTNAPIGFLFMHPGVEAAEASAPKIVQKIKVANLDSAFATSGGDPRAAVSFTFKAPNADPGSLHSYGENQLLATLLQYDEAHEHLRPEDFYSVGPVLGNQMVVKVAAVPRHPAQLYEAGSCLLLFLALFYFWRRYQASLPRGRMFGAFIIILFTLRFAYEFLKENQVEFEEELALNMGQLLSIPLIIFGLYMFSRSYSKQMADKSGEVIS